MGNIAIDFKTELLKTFDDLPEDKQIEVLDFADFVKAKLEAQIVAEEILEDQETMARLGASEEDVTAERVVEWRKVRKNV